MSINQIDKLFNNFYQSVYKIFNDQANTKRYLTRTEKLQLEGEKIRRELDEKKRADLEDFTCEICLESYDKSSDQGFSLSECYHVFCKECLRYYIINNTDGYLICPSSKCTIYLKDFQIKTLLNESEYLKFKLKCLKQIEGQLGKSSFHCKTLDCVGFCSIEKKVSKYTKNLFFCPICNETNCIDCEAIHNGQTCHDFTLWSNSPEKRRCIEGKESVEVLIRSGEIMKCPKCCTLLQRDSGMCQYIRCFLCKMDICWLTKGPRWGPGGKGDTSKGCRCGVNGIRCHPDCTNCH